MFSIKIMRVRGQSMFPTLQANDYVVIAKWPGMSLSTGEIVVVTHPCLATIIKRIQQQSDTGKLWLAGDNSLSTTSEHIGWVPVSAVKGKVIYNITANKPGCKKDVAVFDAQRPSR